LSNQSVKNVKKGFLICSFGGSQSVNDATPVAKNNPESIGHKMEKIESYRFNGFSLWSEPKSKKVWWITNWTITKDGKEIYRLDNQGTLPSEVLRAWAKATKLKP